MGKYSLLWIGLFVFTISNAQWKALNTGTTKTLNSVYFINDSVGYAVGDSGTIVKTINRGNGWLKQNSNVYARLNSVFFHNSNVGYIVGEDAVFLKTIDGGTNWIQQSLNLPQSTVLNAIGFSSDSVGYISSGLYSSTTNTNIIIKTKDRWASWEIDSFGSGITSSMCFPTKDTGYVFGNCIRKTTNGGKDWQSKSFNNINLNAVSGGATSQIIMAVGDSGQIVYGRLLSSGIPDVLNIGTRQNLNHTDFQYIVGDSGLLYKWNYSISTNPNLDIQKINLGITNNLNCVTSYSNSNYFAVIVGDSGTVLVKTDWNPFVKVNTNTTRNLNSVALSNNSSHLSACIVGDSGVILKVNDTIVSNLGNQVTTKKLSFVSVCKYDDSYIGVGEKGTIIKLNYYSNNAQLIQIDSNIDLYYIHFIGSDKIGFASGFDNSKNKSVILNTSDAGRTWSLIYPGTTNILRRGGDDVIVGEGGTILFANKYLSSNKINLSHWQERDLFYLDDYSTIKSTIFFTSANTGYAAVEHHGSGGVYKTTDGGNNWTRTSGIIAYKTSMFFTDSLNGYLCGGEGTISQTNNAGGSWHIATDLPVSYSYLKSIFFPSKNFGYVVGQYGAAWRTGIITTKTYEICEGSTLKLEASWGGASYSWEVGPKKQAITVKPSATKKYTVKIGYPGSGGFEIEEYIVKVKPKPSLEVNNSAIAPGQTAKLCASGGVSYLWNTGQTDSCIYTSPQNDTFYTVIITVDNGCSYIDTSFVTVGFPAATDDMPYAESKLFLHPNPVNNILTVEIPKKTKTSLLSILNVSGQELIKQEISTEKTSINLGDLSKGVYFVRIINEENVLVRKIIKE